MTMSISIACTCCATSRTESRELKEHCDILRQRRNECGLQSAKEIEALYPQFRTEQALEYAKDSGVLFKSGIMERCTSWGCAMLCTASCTVISLAGAARCGAASGKYPSVQEVIATAKAAGAVLVFAHPTVYKSMPLVRQLAKEGIIDGIEVEHPRNSPEDRAECAALCEQYGLIHTGGTDFHGANHKVPHPVGTCTTADDQVARILELAHKRRGIDV